jgi:hypothetical protein
MRALRTKLTAVVLTGIAGAGLSTATATAMADGQAITDMIGGLPNLIGYCQGLGYSTAKPLDPGDAYSWACVDESTGGTGAGVTADAAARVIAKAVTTGRPRTRYTIGRDAAMITRLTRFLPDRALDRVLATNLRRHHPKAATPAVAR